MAGRVVGWAKTVLNRDEKVSGEDDEEVGSRMASALFECATCESIYVSDQLHTCPHCGHLVQQVPNEQDLGIL